MYVKKIEKIIKRHKNTASQFHHDYITYKILVLLKITKSLYSSNEKRSYNN